MQLEKLVNMVSRLPPARQQEVMDFAAFLERRYGEKDQAAVADWTEQEFRTLSTEQAMRGIEDEPELYSEEDVKEHWR
jgi:hypothetical protein